MRITVAKLQDMLTESERDLETALDRVGDLTSIIHEREATIQEQQDDAQAADEAHAKAIADKDSTIKYQRDQTSDTQDKLNELHLIFDALQVPRYVDCDDTVHYSSKMELTLVARFVIYQQGVPNEDA